MPNPHAATLLELTQHPDRRVARLAARLLGALDAGHERRTFMLRIMLTESERMELEEGSQKTGETMSEYARSKIFAE